MHRARLGETTQAFAKSRRRRKPPGVQFRIAARKPADVAVRRRRLVGERREWNDLGPGRPPALHEMRIDEREGRVARERDALSRRPNGEPAPARATARSRSPASARTRPQSTWVSMKSAIASSRASSASVSPACTRPRWRSGSAIVLVARQRADDRHAHRFDRLDDEPAMALAADAIDDDARDLEPLVISCAALDDRRRRLRLTRHVDDQQDRHAERRRHVGRGAGAPACRGNAVEQPHRGFAQSERALSAACAASGGEKVGRHGPGIEIDALPPRRCGMKGRIDIVGTGLEADHVDAAALERAQEAERRRRLAAAGARRGDHEPAGHRRRLMRAPRGRSQAPGSRLVLRRCKRPRRTLRPSRASAPAGPSFEGPAAAEPPQDEVADCDARVLVEQLHSPCPGA